MKRPSNFSAERQRLSARFARRRLPTGAGNRALGQHIVERGAAPGQAAAQIGASTEAHTS